MFMSPTIFPRAKSLREWLVWIMAPFGLWPFDDDAAVVLCCSLDSAIRASERGAVRGRMIRRITKVFQVESTVCCMESVPA